MNRQNLNLLETVLSSPYLRYAHSVLSSYCGEGRRRFARWLVTSTPRVFSSLIYIDPYFTRLKSWTGRREGAIRLSLDDGPAAHEFLQDDYDEDNEDIADDEPLAMRAQQLKSIGGQNEGESRGSVELVLPNTPPPPPPKT